MTHIYNYDLKKKECINISVKCAIVYKEMVQSNSHL